MAKNKFLTTLQDIASLMEAHTPQKEIMTTSDVCRYLGFSKSYLYKLSSEKLIPHYKPLNKTMFFKRSEIDDWILAHPVATRDEFLERALVRLKRGTARVSSGK